MSCREALDADLLAHGLRTSPELAGVHELDRQPTARVAARGAREVLSQPPFGVRGPPAVERVIRAAQEVHERRHARRDNRTPGRMVAPANRDPSGETFDERKF